MPRSTAKAVVSEAAGPLSSQAGSAKVVDLEGLAQRLERFERHARAAGDIALYRFAIPQGGQVAALGAADQSRDAADQLHLVVALTGGAIAKTPNALDVRVPVTAAARFEALARPLLAAYLVAFDRSGDRKQG